MKKILAAALALALALAALPALAAEEVNVFNWEDYICDDAIKLFEEETGIKVNYMRFTTNEDMLVQVENDPANYDVIFPSDYIIERLISKDLLEELDYSQLPNATENTLDWLKSTDYDPTGAYSVPYMWGTVGILYNKTMVSAPITSWTSMWDEQYVDNVFMMDSIRDTLGVTLKMLGYSMNTRDKDALNEAKEKLIEQKKAGIVKAYQVDETKDKMIAGEAAMGLMWSGDAAYAMSYSDDLAYVVPEEGSNVWVDGLCVPKGAKNYDNAMKFINFLCRPDICAANLDYLGYSAPETAAKELMDPEVTSSPVAYPDDETLARTESFGALSTQATQMMNDLWLNVKTTGSNTTLYIVISVVAVLAVAAVFIVMNARRRLKKSRRCK